MWLLKGDTFSLWLEPNGDLKILWGIGIPGAGKTIIASLVIQALETLARESGRDICIAYVYIRYSDRTEMTVRSILEVFLRQTLERHPEFIPNTQRVYAPHIAEGTRPTEAELLELMSELTECFDTTYVLDALDEASPEVQLDLVKKLSLLNCKIFVTSRPLHALEAHFPKAHRFTIFAHDDDLDLLIQHQLKTSSHMQELLSKVNDLVTEELVNVIKLKCGGMFLHASLQLSAVSQAPSLRDVKEILEAFPSEVEDVYLRTWKQILDQNLRKVQFAKTALLWVLNAHRSMSIEELQHAVAASFDMHEFDSERMVSGATLLEFCRGLITMEEESRLVRLVHDTARKPLEGLLLPFFPHPHSLLSSVCITHLTSRAFQNTAINSKDELQKALDADPLLAYAHHSWAFHSNSSIHEETGSASHVAKFVAECHAFPVVISGPEVFDLLGPLHTVAFCRLSTIFARPGDYADPNTPTKEGRYTPLGLACLRGNQDLVQTLLPLPNIHVNVGICGEGASALMLAALGGHYHIVEILLTNSETDVNLLNQRGWSAIAAAATTGHDAIVKLLLTRSEIDVNLQNEEGWSALILAASRGYEAVVEVLLAHPKVSVNSLDKRGWSALMLAAFNGHAGTAKLLLAHPEVDVNLASEIGWSALIQAVSRNHESVLELLISHPKVNVNAQDSDGQSALRLAAFAGHANAFRLLLGHPDIEVNAGDRDGCSALIHAASNDHPDIVRLFIDHPQNQVNTASPHGTTALLAAAEYGNTEVVKLLVGVPDIGLNPVDGHGDTPIKLAAEGGHTEIVRVLLNVPNIDTTVIASGSNGHTAMSSALAHGHEEIVQLLLDFESRKPTPTVGVGAAHEVGEEVMDAVHEQVSDSDSETSEYQDALDSL